MVGGFGSCSPVDLESSADNLSILMSLASQGFHEVSQTHCYEILIVVIRFDNCFDIMGPWNSELKGRFLCQDQRSFKQAHAYL